MFNIRCFSPGLKWRELKLLDNPYERTEDIKCAVDYLTTLPYIDRKRIDVIVQCAGAGNAVFATLTDRRKKAVCGICSWILEKHQD